MSNKAQLQTNNTELTNLITALQDKAVGGDTSVELQEKTVTPATSSQTIIADTGYDGLSKVTVNAMPTATQATPTISVSSAGLITASSTQTAGYVAAGIKSATKQLSTQAAQTITPGTSNKTIASGKYLTGTQTIKGDANLIPANIADGISIFGVTGTHSAGGSGGATIDTCSVDLTVSTGSFSVSYTTLDEDGNIIHRVENVYAESKTITCVCYTIIALTTYLYQINNTAHSLTKAELLSTATGHASIIGLTAAAGETAQCKAYSSGGAAVD